MYLRLLMLLACLSAMRLAAEEVEIRFFTGARLPATELRLEGEQLHFRIDGEPDASPFSVISELIFPLPPWAPAESPPHQLRFLNGETWWGEVLEIGEAVLRFRRMDGQEMLAERTQVQEIRFRPPAADLTVAGLEALQAWQAQGAERALLPPFAPPEGTVLDVMSGGGPGTVGHLLPPVPPRFVLELQFWFPLPDGQARLLLFSSRDNLRVHVRGATLTVMRPHGLQFRTNHAEDLDQRRMDAAFPAPPRRRLNLQLQVDTVARRTRLYADGRLLEEVEGGTFADEALAQPWWFGIQQLTQGGLTLESLTLTADSGRPLPERFDPPGPMPFVWLANGDALPFTRAAPLEGAWHFETSMGGIRLPADRIRGLVFQGLSAAAPANETVQISLPGLRATVYGRLLEIRDGGLRVESVNWRGPDPLRLPLSAVRRIRHLEVRGVEE